MQSSESQCFVMNHLESETPQPSSGSSSWQTEDLFLFRLDSLVSVHLEQAACGDGVVVEHLEMKFIIIGLIFSVAGADGSGISARGSAYRLICRKHPFGWLFGRLAMYAWMCLYVVAIQWYCNRTMMKDIAKHPNIGNKQVCVIVQWCWNRTIMKE